MYRSYVITTFISLDLKLSGSCLLIICEIFDVKFWASFTLQACRTDTRKWECITLMHGCPLFTLFTLGRLRLSQPKRRLLVLQLVAMRCWEKNRYTHMHRNSSLVLMSFLNSKLEYIWISYNYMNIFTTGKYSVFSDGIDSNSPPLYYSKIMFSFLLHRSALFQCSLCAYARRWQFKLQNFLTHSTLGQGGSEL